jgi:hypothetical protein
MEQFLNLENKKFHTVGTVPKSRKTNNTTLLEPFQNLAKQIVFLDFGTVPTVWYYLFF